MIHARTLFVVAIVGAHASTLFAGDGWSLPRLLPFGASKQKPSPRTPVEPPRYLRKTKKPGLFDMPDLFSLPGRKRSSRPTANRAGASNPSLLSRMNNSTKRIFANTKEALTPGWMSRRSEPQRTARRATPKTKSPASKFNPVSWLVPKQLKPTTKVERRVVRPETSWLGKPRPSER